MTKLSEPRLPTRDRTQDSFGNDARRMAVSEIGYTEGALNVYDEEIYNASSGDAIIAPAGLNRFKLWMFEVTGITVDSFNFQIALNPATSFPNSQFLAVALTGVAKAPQATITANGVYFAVADVDNAATQPGTTSFNALFLDRTGTTDTIVVRALGRV